jgi:hypothetical protein
LDFSPHVQYIPDAVCEKNTGADATTGSVAAALQFQI